MAMLMWMIGYFVIGVILAVLAVLSDNDIDGPEAIMITVLFWPLLLCALAVITAVRFLANVIRRFLVAMRGR